MYFQSKCFILISSRKCINYLCGSQFSILKYLISSDPYCLKYFCIFVERKTMDKVYQAWKDFRCGLIESRKNTNIKHCFSKEIKMLSLCSLAPAVICLCFSYLFEWDCDLLSIGIMVVLMAYLMNEREKDTVNMQSLSHIAVWIRNAALSSAGILSVIFPFFCEKTTLETMWPLNALFLSYFMVMKYLAIYRVYLNLWKAFAVYLRQMKLVETFFNKDHPDHETIETDGETSQVKKEK